MLCIIWTFSTKCMRFCILQHCVCKFFFNLLYCVRIRILPVTSAKKIRKPVRILHFGKSADPHFTGGHGNLRNAKVRKVICEIKAAAPACCTRQTNAYTTLTLTFWRHICVLKPHVLIHVFNYYLAVKLSMNSVYFFTTWPLRTSVSIVRVGLTIWLTDRMATVS